METRIALIGIIVENPESIEALNHLLHEYGKYIIGRMGIPYREREVNIIREFIHYSSGFSFYICWATAQQREEAQRIRAGSACSVAR